METLNIKTIYSAFMGEVNIHGIGVACTFVRLAGCNLRCYFKTKGTLCDTPEALAKNSGSYMTIPHIIKRVAEIGNRVVCITGGEPLMQDVTLLLTELSNNGYKVVVETNGTYSIAPYRHIRDVSFVVDVKSTSSGEHKKMLEDNYSLLDKNDFVKFVIDTEEDFLEFDEWVCRHGGLPFNIAVGTFWGSEVSYQWLVKSLQNYKGVFLNMQTHKMICLYDRYKSDTSFEDLYIPKDL